METVEDINYVTPQVKDLPPGSSVYLAEHFDNVDSFKKKWIKSETKKEGIDEDIAKYDGMLIISKHIVIHSFFSFTTVGLLLSKLSFHVTFVLKKFKSRLSYNCA